MRNPLEHPGETPVTFVCAIAYITLAFLTDPFDPSTPDLFAYGMLIPFVVPDEPWRLLSYAFLHGGMLHLLLNTAALAVFGPMLERSLGSLRFAVLYAVSAVGGGVAVCVYCDWMQPVVGGSGALFGMLGAAVAMNMRSGRHLLSFLEFEGPRALLSLIAINLVLGLVIPRISNTGHVGGLLAGFLLTFFFLQQPREALNAPAIGLRAAIAALYLACLVYSLVPVARADWLLARWDAAAPGPHREALKAAFVLAHTGDRTLDDRELGSVADLQLLAFRQQLAKLREELQQR